VEIKINPSMVCADLSQLGNQVEQLTAAKVDMFHWDIMDGVFVHNFCLTPDVIAACRPFSKLPFDVHLCITDPASFIDRIAEIGADIISLQLENTPHLHRAVENIHKKGKQAGVVINPATPLSHLESILPELQMVTVMTVDVGFTGQNFIYSMLDKITNLKDIINKRELEVDIQVDGQINSKTIRQVINAGANVLVLGTSGLFNLSSNLEEAVMQVKQHIQSIIMNQ